MSDLKEKLKKITISSMKSRDKETLSFARNLQASIRKKEIDTKSNLDNNGVIDICASLLKQRNESIKQFEKGNRQDLVDKEKKERDFLKTFLPKELSEEELVKIIDETLNELNVKDIKNMGSVMKTIMPKVKGKVDGKKLSEMVRKRLEKK